MKSECDRVDLSIVVVSWNVDEYLCQCLHSLRAHVDRELKYEIIVVDNHSNDNTVSMLESDFPEVKLIRNQKNLGFARANNQGLKISLGKYVLLLNPDTQLEEGCISTLISFLSRLADSLVARRKRVSASIISMHQ